MAGETSRESYVRVAREVDATLHVVKFCSRVEDIANEMLPRDRTGRRIARSPEEMSREGLNPKIRDINISAAKVHDSDNLHTSLFERRLPRNQRNNSNLVRLLGYLTNVDMKVLVDDEGPSPESITVNCSYLIDTTHRLQDPLRREFSLVMDEGPGLWRTRKEHANLHELVANRSRRHVDQVVAEDPWALPGFVPFLTLSKWTDPRAVNEFIERINFDGQSAPLVSLDLRLPEIDSKIR